MSWYQIKHRETGEVQYVAGLGGVNLDDHDCIEILDDRPPEGLEQVGADGRLFVPLDAAKDAKKAEVMGVLASKFQAGFVPASGPLAGKTLQTRDEDKTNWLTSQAAYSAQVAAGQGAVVGANFRTATNEVISCTFQEGLETLLAMAAWGADLYANSWALKDAISAVAVIDGDIDRAVAKLEAIDITAGWPE